MEAVDQALDIVFIILSVKWQMKKLVNAAWQWRNNTCPHPA
jgi:hypothetical protein